jgi:hypothetical protein
MPPPFVAFPPPPSYAVTVQTHADIEAIRNSVPAFAATPQSSWASDTPTVRSATPTGGQRGATVAAAAAVASTATQTPCEVETQTEPSRHDDPPRVSVVVPV